MPQQLPTRRAIQVFAAFAFAYFFATLVRAITATLSPVLTAEFALQARDLGLLAGAYFLGFTLTQLPLGHWLDRQGPRRVLLCFLALAVLGCMAFAVAQSFSMLVLARVLCGVGLSACLMAPLTGYRRWMAPGFQLRASSWMLMTGSLGAVASTLPVQWLLPVVGWRPLFWGLAVLLLLAIAAIRWQVPGAVSPADVPLAATPAAAGSAVSAAGYVDILRSPYFRRMAPLAFFSYGGLIAVLTLWAAPWMTALGGYTPLQAATGLFWINVAVLLTYWTWGLAGPWLARRGLHTDLLLLRGLPLSFVALLLLVLLPAGMQQQGTVVLLAAFCVTSTFVTPLQPAVGMAFGPELAGRALSAFNLVVFLGVFALQWSIGLGVDALRALGWSQADALRGAFAALLLACVCAYMYFLRGARHNGRPSSP